MLDRVNCKIKRHYILKRELLVWNDADKRIESFYKIRKHVKRLGRFIGTARDSPVDLNAHLMIMFYDIMLLDDTVSLINSHNRRRHLLESLIYCISGRANIGDREVINFLSLDISQLFSKVFARVII